MKNYKILENGIYYAELDGRKGSYETGKQNGEIFSDLIKENVKLMKDIYSESVGEDGLDAILNDMLTSRYIDDLKSYMPALYDEMTGIADGSGITLKEAFMLNYLEEVPNAIMLQAENQCTAVSVINRDDLPNLLFQNMDFTEAYEGFQALYKIKYPEKEILMYGFVGQFGGIGVNSKGLGVTINVVSNIAPSVGCGIPSTAVTRAILEQDTTADCESLFARIPISTGGSYCVTDPVSAICFEASANHIEKITPVDNKYIIHTNHAIQSNDLVDVPGQFEANHPIPGQDGKSPFETVERYELAESIVSRRSEMLDVEGAKEILSTKPILLHCVLNADIECNTLQSVINICSAETPGLFVAKGAKEDRTYSYMGFNR